MIRDGHSVADGGDYVPSGAELTPDQLGFTASNHTVTLYVEGVQPNAANYWAHTPIKAELASDGSDFTNQDTVNTTVVYSEAGWKQVVYQKSDFNPYTWNPRYGYTFNHDDLSAIYSFYGQLYNQSVTDAGGNPANAKFEWPGLAKVAGEQIMSGLALSSNVGAFTLAIQAQINANPAIAKLPNVVSLAWLALGLTNLSGSNPNIVPQILATQAQTMKGSYAIFDDLAWNFEAYEVGGIKEIQRQAASGAISSTPASGSDMLQAFQAIDSGTPNGIWTGNLMVINREQKVVLQRYLTPLNGLWVGNLPASLLATIGGSRSAPFPGSQTLLSWEAGSATPGLFTDLNTRLQYINYLWSLWQQLPGAQRLADVGVALP